MAGGKAGDGDGSSGAKDDDVTAFPVLTKTIYTDWAILMRIKLKAHGLWIAINKGGVDPQEDMMELDALVSVVPPEMVVTVVDKKTMKEAWDAIAMLRIGDDWVRKVMA
jgi:hypothetical protein